ncbi:MAG: hypothetical protein ACYDA9_08180 [Terriglobia bacterium]
MKRQCRAALVCFAGLVAVLSGCGRFSGINSKAAVQAAIEAHLKQRPGLALSNMTTDVQDVKFDGDKATAQVVYQSNSVPDLKVEVGYVLRRQGDHWEVESSTPMGGIGGNPHGGVAVPQSNGSPSQSVPASPHGAMPPQASH